jgi:hypothetical protein
MLPNKRRENMKTFSQMFAKKWDEGFYVTDNCLIFEKKQVFIERKTNGELVEVEKNIYVGGDISKWHESNAMEYLYFKAKDPKFGHGSPTFWNLIFEMLEEDSDENIALHYKNNEKKWIDQGLEILNIETEISNDGFIGYELTIRFNLAEKLLEKLFIALNAERYGE